jgi:two-component system cell cycle sensor histidine kinase/response regulator CckA
VPRQTILVVYDEEMICRIVSRQLEGEGFLCITAHSGEAALEWLRTNPWPDLFIVDIQLGSMSGIEFVLESLKQHPGTPVLFISGYSQTMPEGDRDLGSAVEFLPKPFAPDQLLACVRQLLATAADQGRSWQGQAS